MGTATSSPAGIATVGMAALLAISILPTRVAGQEPATPRFRSAVQAVAVSAVVRDRKGRYVRDLSREDFELFDRGIRRRLTDFRAEGSAPASVAILFDSSGSMHVASKLEQGRQAARHLLAALDDAYAPDARKDDTVAVFMFDTRLKEVQPFTKDRAAVLKTLDTVLPFGETSIFDAIAEAATKVVARGTTRRAIVVITDGIDTGSEATPQQAALAASKVDVPVYTIEVVPPIDHEPDAGGERTEEALPGSELSQLAEATGGAAFVASAPAHHSLAVRRIVAELRHQYLLAFETSDAPGWHPVDVKTRDRDLRVRARAGYFVGGSSGGAESVGKRPM